MTGIVISVPKLTSLSAKLIIAFDFLMKFKPKMISCFKYGVIMTGTFQRLLSEVKFCSTQYVYLFTINTEDLKIEIDGS